LNRLLFLEFASHVGGSYVLLPKNSRPIDRSTNLPDFAYELRDSP